MKNLIEQIKKVDGILLAMVLIGIAGTVASLSLVIQCIML